MAKTSQEIEREMINGLQDGTGRNLADWLSAIAQAGKSSRADIIDWLKSSQGFNHMNASMLAAIHANGGKAVYANPDELIDNQFKGKEDLRPLYEALKSSIAGVNSHWQFVPTKMYTSIRNGKEFAAIVVKKDALKVAMDLGDVPFDEYFTPAKNLGPMPRISHAATVRSTSDIAPKLLDWLRKADAAVNSK